MLNENIETYDSADIKDFETYKGLTNFTDGYNKRLKIFMQIFEDYKHRDRKIFKLLEYHNIDKYTKLCLDYDTFYLVANNNEKGYSVNDVLINLDYHIKCMKNSFQINFKS
jgi:hypothetical protein